MQSVRRGTGRSEIYWFNWPSRLGGADTKLVHLLPLLGREYAITVVPNDVRCLRMRGWREYLERAGVKAVARREVPRDLRGCWAVSMCNRSFFRGIAQEMKGRGARVAWSNDMMWMFTGELEAVRDGLVDTVMYVSEEQRRALEPDYLEACGGGAKVTGGGKWGTLRGPGGRGLRWVMSGNWISPAEFPFRQRGVEGGGPFTIGRVSRPDPDKFPYDFPQSYERLGLEGRVKFRVLGWSEGMAERYCEHRWDRRWELLPADSVPVAGFLQTLDVFVYDVSPRFCESWGRAVVEAMLCGVVPVVPRGGGHHLEKLVRHGESGFLCDSREDFGWYCRMLQDDPALLAHLSAGARAHAVREHCREADHLALWRRVFR